MEIRWGVLPLKVSSSHARFEKFANGFGVDVLLTRLDDRLSDKCFAFLS